MVVERVELRVIRMRLKEPFETSFGREHDREAILVTVYADGLEGWGEVVASRDFGYSYETIETAWHVLRAFLIPAVLGQDIPDIETVARIGERLRGHPMARAGLEAAFWDLLARQADLPLARYLGGTRDRVPVGVSIGLQPTDELLLEKIRGYLEEGYQRIKVKIKPGRDVEMIAAIRRMFPEIPLMADANSAYRLEDADRLAALDEFHLMMIEQPLHWDDLYEHSLLQARLRTPICLDESIHTARHAWAALEMGACRIINIKPGRVGGLLEAKRIHDLCCARGIPVWCGGMLETGIGRAANVALASLPGFTLPGDLSASHRYYHEDLIDPPFALNPDGTLSVPTGPGLGVHIDRRKVDRATLRMEAFQI
ncbi:o-succinylbenzoate synthase [Thermoflexus sp.]|uniref:o-succinylbenzoate synthase n=1 Tax=Thermoflexus sp. TaxID=1969742 RepID=UPI0035E43E9D